MLTIVRILQRSTALALAAATLLTSGLAAQNGRGSGQTSYSLMQLTVKSDQISVEEFSAQTSEIRSCADARALAKELDADIKRDRFVMPHHIPESLKEELSRLPTGQATKVFSADPTVMRVIVICHRV
uniref:hypothetical protein n=1 Tax=uncultured Altererythrobacter sp. TaxID=500840 RepID=UPI002601E20F|nr:hypothetical protein [uncultured Altererythrobacter sp.]